MTSRDGASLRSAARVRRGGRRGGRPAVRRSVGWLLVGLVLTACGHATTGGAVSRPAAASVASPGPWSTALPSSRAEDALAAVPSACASRLRAELAAGAVQDAGCAPERRRVLDAAAPDDAARFGAGRVWQRDATGFWLEIFDAHRCDRWPLRSRDSAILSPAAATRAGCRLSPRRRGLTVEVVDTAGGVLVLPDAIPVPDGRARLSTEALLSVVLSTDAVVDVREVAALRLGEGGWLLTIPMAPLLTYLAAKELSWIERGWGTPRDAGIFAPAHPAPERMGLLRLERLMLRQQLDFARVQAGTMAGATFLARHPWSPYRASVRRTLGLAPSAGAVSVPPVPEDAELDTERGASGP